MRGPSSHPSTTPPGRRPDLPGIGADGRGRGIARVALLATVQAIAAGIAAFATRDIFAALRDAAPDLPTRALATLAGAGLVIGLARVGERLAAERIGQRYVGALRMALFSHLSRMAQSDLARRRTGGLSMRFIGDLGAIRTWVSLGLARLVSACIVLPSATAVLFLIEPRLGLAAALPVALGLAAMAVLGPRLGPAHRHLRQRRTRLSAAMLERVPHAPELRLLGRIERERAQLARRTEALLESALVRAGGAAWLRAIPDIAGGLAATTVLLTVLRLRLEPSDAAGALAALGLMMRPMRDLASVWDRHRAWQVARDKCRIVLAAPILDRSRDRAPTPSTPDRSPATAAEAARLPLPALSFRHLATSELRNLDARIRPGTKVTLVGPNGAGKSTLLRLAAGLEQPATGQVLLDGVAPVTMRPRDRRRRIALMTAGSPILAGSLRRALTMGMTGRLRDRDIVAMAARFGLEAAIERLGGLEGRISEGGRNLSSGECRRILLARMALSNAPLLLLDEPDETLDADGIDQLSQWLGAVEATVIVATHDPDIARQGDEIWFIDGGTLVEAGPSEQLLTSRTSQTARHFRTRTTSPVMGRRSGLAARPLTDPAARPQTRITAAAAAPSVVSLKYAA